MARPKKKRGETLEPLPVRVPTELVEEVKRIAVMLDRSDSYITRKLFIRGLIAYRRDMLLDDPVIVTDLTDNNEKPVIDMTVDREFKPTSDVMPVETETKED